MKATKRSINVQCRKVQSTFSVDSLIVFAFCLNLQSHELTSVSTFNLNPKQPYHRLDTRRYRIDYVNPRRRNMWLHECQRNWKRPYAQLGMYEHTHAIYEKRMNYLHKERNIEDERIAVKNGEKKKSSTAVVSISNYRLRANTIPNHSARVLATWELTTVLTLRISTSASV